MGDGRYNGIIASTVAEIRGALPLVTEGILQEVIHHSTILWRKLTNVTVCVRTPGVSGRYSTSS